MQPTLPTDNTTICNKYTVTSSFAPATSFLLAQFLRSQISNRSPAQLQPHTAAFDLLSAATPLEFARQADTNLITRGQREAGSVPWRILNTTLYAFLKTLRAAGMSDRQ